MLVIGHVVDAIRGAYRYISMCFELKLDTELEGGADLNVVFSTPAVVFLQL